MPSTPDSPNLFAPFLLWADLGLRAAETAVASTQNMTDGADRVTRAVASADGAELAPTSADTDEHASFWQPDPDGIAGLQRLMWDLATHNWMQWVTALHNMVAAGAGVGLARAVAGQDNPLEAAQHSLRTAAWGDSRAADAEPVRTAAAAQRRRNRAVTDEAQHAMASHEAKPRRKAAAKSRRGQRSTRK